MELHPACEIRMWSAETFQVPYMSQRIHTESFIAISSAKYSQMSRIIYIKFRKKFFVTFQVPIHKVFIHTVFLFIYHNFRTTLHIFIRLNGRVNFEF